MGDKEKKVDKSPGEKEGEKEEGKAEEEEPKYAEGSSKAYFEELGLNPELHKNDFGPDEALAIFAKAKDALETRRENKKLVADICRQAWGLFKILA